MGGRISTRRMPLTKWLRFALIAGGLSGCLTKTPKPAGFLWDSVDQRLAALYLPRLFPYVAGAHAKGDSLTSYRWEVMGKAGDTVYYGISRPARSLYKNRREAVVGRFVWGDTGFVYYEELFWTRRLPSDTLRPLLVELLTRWAAGRWDTLALLECCVSFPDLNTVYDPSRRRWIHKHLPLIP